MIAPDVLLKPLQIRREIERKQMRIETLRISQFDTSPLERSLEDLHDVEV